MPFNSTFALVASHDVVRTELLETPLTDPAPEDLLEEARRPTSRSDDDQVFSVDVDPGGNVTIHSVVPRGIAIELGPLGRRLVATEAFAAGHVLYRGRAAFLDLSTCGHGFDIVLYNEEGDIVNCCRNSDVQSVSDKEAFDGARQVYGFDGFMNHSCDANIILPQVARTSEGLVYDAVALRDIAIGEELTCDYALFDYDCSGHEIEECLCGSSKCRGKMMGFKQLDFAEQVDIMHLCERDVVKAFIRENPDIVLLRSAMPEGLALVLRSGDNHLVASRRFEIGEKVFTNHAEIVSLEDVKSKRFIVEVDGRYVQLDNEHHFIFRPEYAENLGFDSFMDHSCEPNVRQAYHDATSYTCYAMRDIQPGERVTCNYLELDNGAENICTVKLTSFSCSCGASKCIGVVHC